MEKVDNEASTLMDAERYKEAEKCFDKLIKVDPADGSFYAFRATCRIETGNIEGAIKDLKTTLCSQWLSDDMRRIVEKQLKNIEKDKSNPFFNKAFGEAFENFEAGKYDNALLLLNKLVKHNPENGTYIALRGECKYELGHSSEAIADLKEALKCKLPDEARKEIETRIIELSS